MPIKIDKKLPAVEILSSENIFVMDDDRADHQDIRPLNILVLNLMPQKMVTETQILPYIAASVRNKILRPGTNVFGMPSASGS